MLKSEKNSHYHVVLLTVWTIIGDVVELDIFILAADAVRTAPLHSKVSHICAYEIRWYQPLDTPADLLDVIPRLHRSMGVPLDLCTQLADTLKGSPPISPPFLSANKSLEKLVRFMDKVPSGKMVGKQAAPATLQAQCGTMSCSPAPLPAASNPVCSPMAGRPGSHCTELDMNHNDTILHSRDDAGSRQHSTPCRQPLLATVTQAHPAQPHQT